MSYDVTLVDPVTGDVLELDEAHRLRGGTYAIGGTTLCELNVTYNYARHFHPLGEHGLRSLDGKPAAETLPALDALIGMLANDADDDYWAPTEGNAKRALCALRSLARLRPDGVWRVG